MAASFSAKDSRTFNFNQEGYSAMYGYKSQEVDLPYVEYDLEEGERLLVILAYASDEDVRSKKLGHSAQGLLTKELVEKLNTEVLTGVREDLPLIKTVSLINFRDKFGERMLDADNYVEGKLFQQWASRVADYVEAYKPTRILVSGEASLKALMYHVCSLQDLSAVEYTEPYLQIGRVFNLDYRGIKIPTSFTLPLHWTASSNPKYIDQAPNLIHQQKFHLEYLLAGHNLYTISDKSTWSKTDIMTIEAFDQFYEELVSADRICIDIETNNLARYANKILTMHFSTDGYHAYNLPLCHRDTPFSAEEILYIQSKLKSYFENEKSDYLIFHNAKFDISVMTAQFNLSFFNHRVYDTIAGVFSLDEQNRYYTAIHVPTYNLRHVAYQYGCNAYDEGEVKKQDRANMNSIPLEHIFEYAAKDVIIPYQVCHFQITEAERRGYKLWKEFVIEQLGAMTLVFVGMETKGILVDKKYLINLCSNDGIVKKLLDEVVDKFKSSDNAKKVNDILVIHDRVVKGMLYSKSAIKKGKRLIAAELKDARKPLRILKKFLDDSNVVAELTSAYDERQRRLPLLEAISQSCDPIAEFFDVAAKEIVKSLTQLKHFDTRVERSDVLVRLEKLRMALEDVNLPKLEEFLLSTAKIKESHLSLKSFREEPVDHSKDWLFNIAKQNSQQLLFFNILGLKPVEQRKDGGGKSNKDFQAAYQEVEEVALYDTYTKYKKLMSTYITGMMQRLESDPDSQLDGRLRADYGYKDVMTGRSSSRNPNFQNIPSRGKFASLIKRQFIAERGAVLIKNDFNAAEVRQWANVSQDKKLASTFRAGMVMRKELFLEEDDAKRDELKLKIKGEGDVHRLNYSFFFGKDPKLVTDEERNAVKAVIFGVIYGKGSRTLAQDLKCTEEQADQLLAKLFTTFKKGGEWIEDTKAATHKSLIATSPIGRVRHLGSLLHRDAKVNSGSDRKICNSVVQGFSSDMGYAGGRILQQLVYKMFQKHGCDLYLYENNTVHDSVEAVTKFEHLPLSLYLVDHAFTTLVQEKYRKIFGLNWVIESEMDSEIGCSIGHTRKMDWRTLPTQVREELEWSSTELEYNYTQEEKSEILRKFDHNYDIMTRIRKYETKKYLEFVKANPDKVYADCVLADSSKLSKLREQLIF